MRSPIFLQHLMNILQVKRGTGWQTAKRGSEPSAGVISSRNIMTLQACRQNNEIQTGDSCDVLKDNLIIKDLQIL